MKYMRDNFTSFGVATIITLLAVPAVISILLTIRNHELENIQVRAVTTEEHSRCGDMPRGSQKTENGRLNCFKKTYGRTAPRVAP